ncbi:MAG: hypothetical protein AB8A39_03550 [Prochlorococcus sp.]
MEAMLKMISALLSMRAPSRLFLTKNAAKAFDPIVFTVAQRQQRQQQTLPASPTSFADQGLSR